jgi:hypothetical protein
MASPAILPRGSTAKGGQAQRTGPPFLESSGAERKMAERRGGCLFALKANNKRRRPWPSSTGMRWISSSSRTPAASASCAVPAPWTSTFLSPVACLASVIAVLTSVT